MYAIIVNEYVSRRSTFLNLGFEPLNGQVMPSFGELN